MLEVDWAWSGPEQVTGDDTQHYPHLGFLLQQPSAFRQVFNNSRFSRVESLSRMILLALLLLERVSFSDAFVPGRARTLVDSRRDRTTFTVSALLPGHFGSNQALNAIDIDSMLEMEWTPIVEDFQRTLYMSTDSGRNKTNHMDDHFPFDNEIEKGGDANDIAKRAARLAVFKNRNGRPVSKAAMRPTSVGERRVGNVNDRRSSTAIIMDTVRNKARGAAMATQDKLMANDDTPKSATKLTSSAIHETVADMIRKRSQSTFAKIGQSMGILGEPKELLIPRSVLSQEEADTQVYVRVASPKDDADIAQLRLSVFSSFPPDVQIQFRTRSCQAIHNRRLRGAICVVATMKDFIIGSAECSFDEFSGTRLGRRRLPYSVLYVTEVAVNPSVRRKGVGYKLLQAIDKVAEARGIESLYLHVEVKNDVAIQLYYKAGYQHVGDDPMFAEFTTSLNLHAGATKGREHYLLCKHLPNRKPTWVPEMGTFSDRPIIGTLGFEIPA